MESYTHTYREFGIYTVTLVITDWAGNVNSTYISLTLVDRSTPDDGVNGFIPSFTLGLSLASIALVSVLIRRKRN